MTRLQTTVLVVLVSLLMVSGAGWWSNRALPRASRTVDRLSKVAKARAGEALHLQATHGDAVWPGWGGALAPLLLWNEANAFWVDPGHRGAPSPAWAAVADDAFGGRTYFRRSVASLEAELDDGELSAFTERVGGQWATSFSTKEWTQIALSDEIRRDLPPPLRPVFPYRLVLGAFTTEWYLTGLLHEAFHAYQAETMPERFGDAERAYADRDRYEAADGAMHDAWATEIDALQRALGADPDSSTGHVRAFLDARARRREAHGLDSALVAYERRMEWLEGTAKYVELAIWRAAAEAPGYVPSPSLAADADFTGYADTFPTRWRRELDQLGRQASHTGDSRFNYTGMALCVLLDRLRPGWQADAAAPDAWLEGLLAEAVGG